MVTVEDTERAVADAQEDLGRVEARQEETGAAIATRERELAAVEEERQRLMALAAAGQDVGTQLARTRAKLQAAQAAVEEATGIQRHLAGMEAEARSRLARAERALSRSLVDAKLRELRAQAIRSQEALEAAFGELNHLLDRQRELHALTPQYASTYRFDLEVRRQAVQYGLFDPARFRFLVPHITIPPDPEGDT
jgi:chromosome segregation ATPase